MLCAEAELLQQGGGGAGVAEFIVDADAAELGGALFAQQRSHSLAQAADDAVLLTGDDLAALAGSLQDDFLIQGLNGADVDDPGMDSLGLQGLEPRTDRL